MVQMVPVDRERLAGKGWCRPNGYPFAAGDAFIPIGASEFPHVASAMPIAFMQQSGRYMPVAVMSTNAGRNLFIGPQNEWLGTHIPAVYRGYPFGRGPSEPGGPMTLCIDEDSGLIVEEGEENAERFFEPDGKLSAVLSQMAKFLELSEQDLVRAQWISMALAEAGLIKAWRLTVPVSGRQVAVEGLYSVDEAALNALDDQLFLKLRKKSALPLAYAQLMSTGQVTKVLAPLATRQEQRAQAQISALGLAPAGSA
jgi:hypothetical protein